METNDTMKPDDENVNDDLRRELRELPRVSAPPDFEARLYRAIEERSVPWWKKPLLGGFLFGRRLPAYVYAISAAVLLLAAGIYLSGVFAPSDKTGILLRQHGEQIEGKLPVKDSSNAARDSLARADTAGHHPAKGAHAVRPVGGAGK